MQGAHMRLGIFGGTFDPVHLGHLILAEQCREQASLDQVWFIPAARPPHKLDRPRTSFLHRAEMLELAIAGNNAFRVDRMEEERPGPSFTVHTLETLRARHPEAELYLIVGSDTLADLVNWYQPARILEMATLLVAARPGNNVLDGQAMGHSLGLSFPVRSQVLVMPLLDISSSVLRDRVAQRRTIRYQVPRSVEVYIQEKGLYLPAPEQEKAPA